jgi:CheY-like chemotaxis protein
MRLVKMMDGSIGVSSKYGEGTTFTAQMVQEVADDTPIGDFADNIAKLRVDRQEFKPSLIAPDAKVLIVDDNEMNLEVISSLLTDTRIRVTTATSGAECITRLKEGSFDVVLLDQMMPVMSGTETLAKIKEEHLADETPVIALTADAIVGARDSYIGEGFTDYLSKPVMYKDLEEALLKYIDKELLLKPEEADASGKPEDLPVILVISPDTDRLNEIKKLLGDKYKGVYVRDEDKAARYLEKHEAAFIIRSV